MCLRRRGRQPRDRHGALRGYPVPVRLACGFRRPPRRVSHRIRSVPGFWSCRCRFSLLTFFSAREAWKRGPPTQVPIGGKSLAEHSKGSFGAVSPKTYPRTTTAAHELAAALIFTSGIIHYADQPARKICQMSDQPVNVQPQLLAVDPQTDAPCYFLGLTVENVRSFGAPQTLDLSDGQGRPAQWVILLKIRSLEWSGNSRRLFEVWRKTRPRGHEPHPYV